MGMTGLGRRPAALSLYLAAHENDVGANLGYALEGNKHLLAEEPPSPTARDRKALDAVFGIEKGDIAHSAEIFSVVEVYDLQLF